MRGQSQLLNQTFFWEWVFCGSKIFTSQGCGAQFLSPCFSPYSESGLRRNKPVVLPIIPTLDFGIIFPFFISVSC